MVKLIIKNDMLNNNANSAQVPLDHPVLFADQKSFFLFFIFFNMYFLWPRLGMPRSGLLTLDTVRAR